MENFLMILMTILPIFLTVAFFTLMERKVMAAMQRRQGPVFMGYFGLLQPFADGLKLLLKEILYPVSMMQILFLGAPLFLLSLSLVQWSLIPFPSLIFSFSGIIFFTYQLLMLLTISSLMVYGIIFAGWASNSRYPFLGAMRAMAQFISYEIIFSLIILMIGLIMNSLNFMDLYLFQNKSCWFIIPLFPFFLMWWIAILAETNRTPFDLPEAEAELVAGYNLEYSSFPFAFFFLSEYGMMLLMSCLTMILFFSGLHLSLFWFMCGILIIAFIFMIIRATVPRLRYDQLSQLGWKMTLPLGFTSFSLLLVSIICYTNY